MSFKIILALPCYNEAENIPYIIQKVEELNKINKMLFEVKVLIIDDASTDNTKEIVEKLKGNLELDIVRHDFNMGLTGGINSSFKYFYDSLSDNSIKSFVLMDGDNSHNPHYISEMFKKIIEGYDVVVASRFRSGSRVLGVPKFRQILSFGLTLVFKSLKNIPGILDYSCGYRMYSPSIVRKTFEQYNGTIVKERSFASMVELLLKVYFQGAILTEIPFMLRYDLKLGNSKMRFLKTILGNLKLLLCLKKSSR